MKKSRIEDAIWLAKQFIERAELCLAAQAETYTHAGGTFHATAPKESGALRRASMDLTRSLAHMRKPK